jgi:hypothetical protein
MIASGQPRNDMKRERASGSARVNSLSQIPKGSKDSMGKFEARNPKLETILNDQKKSVQPVYGFHDLDLSFSVCFGFRIFIRTQTPLLTIGPKSNIQAFRYSLEVR